MCGLAGITEPGPNDAHAIERMLDLIQYRGPDQRGGFLDDRLALGHLRLTIVDPLGGRQPRVDDETGDVLAFNGEIYGYRELAVELRRSGGVLADNSDTEVLFRLIRLHGVERALAMVDGMFAFAFREGATGTVYLARDRFGEKPLYYANDGGRLLFASEIKALRAHPALAQAPFDPVAVDQYLTFDYIPAPRTFFEGISKLPPGHLLRFQDGDISTAAYWRPTIGSATLAPTVEMSEEACLRRLEELLDDSVRKRLVADVPVGIFLSGGVDSSLIAALAARHAPDVRSYSVKMPDGAYDESPHAEAVARHVGIKHEVIPVSGDELLRSFREVVAAIDEPFADSSLIPTYMLCRAARREVKVALGGDGGDELFMGYPNFFVHRFAALMAAIPRPLGEGLRSVTDMLSSSGEYMGLSFRLKQLFQGFGHHPDLQSFHWMAPFSDAAKGRLYSAGMKATLGQVDAMAPVQSALRAYGANDPLERLAGLFTSLYLADDILTKVDRASMYNSLEVRAPFLDRTFAEYAMALPSDMKLRGRQTKYILKKLAARHIPSEVVYRPKHGFNFPVTEFTRTTMREVVDQTLRNSDNPLASMFDRGIVEQLWSDHASGRRDHRKMIWSLFILYGAAARQCRP